MEDQQSINLLVVDDDPDFRNVIVRRFERKGHLVTQTGFPREALQLCQTRHFDVAILDISMPEMDGITLLEEMRKINPDTQVIMLTGQGTIGTAIRAMKLGAFDYLTKPCELAALEVQVQRAYETIRLREENRNLRTVLQRTEADKPIIGISPAIRRVMRIIEKVAKSDSTVLIQGESGTGKELVARALHQGSDKRDQPLVTINCAALQETLLESELFGHEKGSFTSAIATKHGLFEVAKSGTLFIDEIGEMAGGLQAKLLRVLEDRNFRRVGGTKELHSDARIIAATNKDLREEVAQKRFRDDLYFRLNVITIEVPPLRDRRQDIPVLIEHFLTGGTSGPRSVDPEALNVMMRYDWPGNVRELANLIERGKILAEGPSITLADLPSDICQTGQTPSTPAATPPNGSLSTQLADLERDHVQKILHSEAGNKARAARTLGISRRKLYRLLEKYGL